MSDEVKTATPKSTATGDPGNPPKSPEDIKLRVKVELDEGPSATRDSLQVGRRLFHFINGTVVASAYAFFFSHQQTIYFLGTLACSAYLLEKLRIAYPEIARRFSKYTNLLLRAEEQFKESSMVPYAMAILLSLITFPKTIALIAVYTLAMADPLAALVGIRFGKRTVVKGKTVEGSAAFFAMTLLVSFFVLYFSVDSSFLFQISIAAFLIATFATAFEMIPIRIDDNLTIPLFVGFTAWICCLLYGLPL